MNKIITFCYWLSIPVFLGFLLYNYALMPEQVSVFLDQLDIVDNGFSKGVFFYVVLGVFILTNTVIYIYRSLYSAPSTPSSNPMFLDTREWLLGLSFFLNAMFTFLVLFIGIYYSRDIDPSQYTFLVFMGPAFLILWFFYLIFLKLSPR